MSYWDSSALIKLYAEEADSPSFERLVEQTTITTCRLAFYEIQTALFRKERDGLLLVGRANIALNKLEADAKAGRIQWIDFSSTLERAFHVVVTTCMQQNPPMLVRTLDAIHLAAAKSSGETEFVATDVRFSAVAQILGLKKLN